MIEKVEMYTVVCDNCGEDVASGQEYSCWNDKSYAEDNAVDSDWHKEDDKHYCPNCFEFDDEDNLIIQSLKK
jgi:hypothetical protein